MAIIKQGILGGFSNKVGAVVGSSWKGIAVMKSKPISVANPRTAGQVAQRTKMKTITQFLSPILADMIKPLNDRFAVRQSGFNVCTSRNLPHVSDAGVIDLDDIVLSQGKLSTPTSLELIANLGSQTLQLIWAPDPVNQYDLNTDLAYIACYNKTTEQWCGFNNQAARVDGIIEFSVSSPVLPAQIVIAYIAFRRFDGTYVSTSASANLV